jgi:hypothetical protein
VDKRTPLLKGFFRQGAGGAAGSGGDSDLCTTYDEFLECVRNAEPGRSVRDVNRMYREVGRCRLSL